MTIPTAETTPQNNIRIEVNTKAFTDALTRLDRILDTTRRPEYKIVHFTLEQDSLFIAAQSDINQLRIRIPTSSEQSKHFRVPNALLTEVVRGATTPDMTLEISDTQLHLHAGTNRSYFTLSGNPDIPPVEFPDETQDSPLTGETLQAMLRHTVYAVGGDANDPVFQNVFLHFTGENSRAVATNGYRLSYWNEAGMELFKDNEVLIPSKEAEHILKNFTAGPIRLHAAMSTITLETDDTIFRTRTEHGNFPQYDRIVPQQYINEIEVDAPALTRIAKRLKLLADPNRNHRLDLLIPTDDGTMTISTEGLHGNAKENVEAQVTMGENPPMISINANYLIEALNPIEGAARIKLSGKTTPLIINAKDHDNYLSMIVPLKDMP